MSRYGAALGNLLTRLLTETPVGRRLYVPDLVADLLPEGELVVDIGCGDGEMGSKLAARVPNATFLGLDRHPPSLQQALDCGVYETALKGSGTRLPFPESSVGAAVALDVIEHLSKGDAERLVSEMARVTRPGGTNVLLTPNGYLPQGSYGGNPYQAHVSDWAVSELEAFGFDVYGANGWRRCRGHRGAIEHPEAWWFLAWLAVSWCSQPLVYRFPGYSFHLLAVRRV